MAKDEVVESTEVEETEELEDETAEVESDDNDESTEEETEEVFTAKDMSKVQGALDKERQLNKDKTAEVKAKNAEIRTLKAELKKSLDSKLEDETVKQTLADAEKRADKFRNIAVEKEAKLALTEAGAKVSTKRLLKLLDLADVELDDTGSVSGLEDAIAELKEESPEFFKSDDDEDEKPTPKRATVRKPGSVDAGTKTPPAPKPLSAAAQMAKLAAGKR